MIPLRDICVFPCSSGLQQCWDYSEESNPLLPKGASFEIQVLFLKWILKYLFQNKLILKRNFKQPIDEVLYVIESSAWFFEKECSF